MAKFIVSDSSYAKHLDANAEGHKDALIQALTDRFYINEKGKVASNGLSTEFLYFPSDLDPRRSPYLKKKIRDVISYTTAFYDIEEINALLKLSPKNESFTSTLGLYLYFADEFSRLHPETTFLTALRDAKVTLQEGPDYYRGDVFKKAMKMLSDYGMKESHGHVLQEWYDKGIYTINGIPSVDDDNNPLGAYTRLARKICSLEKMIPLNLVISYALGNKATAEKVTPAEMYHYTDSLTKIIQPVSNTMTIDPRVVACINEGNEIRIERIENILKNKFFDEWQGKKHADDIENKNLASSIFSALPISALELFYREGYNLAYSDYHNISKCYPDEPFPGNSKKDHALFLTNQGNRQMRYRTLFISNGNNINDQLGRKNIRLTQTVMHEIMHMAIGNLKDEDFDALFKKAAIWHEELSKLQKNQKLPSNFNDKLKTLSRYTLSDALDYSSPQYKGYSDKNKKEEVICNLAGFMYTECPYPPKPGVPNSIYQNDSLDAFARQIDTSLKIACAVSAEKTPDITIADLNSQQGRGFGKSLM